MEAAQLRLERMLPELRDLEQKRVFTKAEISAIVKQRTAHEMAIARPKSEEPYLQYINYERRLEKLRKIRLKKLGPQKAFTVSDWAIPRHIITLYTLATQRFRSSLPLWNSYISYTLTLSAPRLTTRALSHAISAHPSLPSFWTLLIRYEVDGDGRGKGGGNVVSARRVAMRGLRMLKGKESVEVWREWIRVELVHMEETRQKLNKLGAGQPRSDRKKGKTKAVADDEVMQGLDEEGSAAGEELEDIEMHSVSGKVESAEATEGLEGMAAGALVKMILNQAFTTVELVDIFDAILPLLRSLPLTIPARSSLLDQTYASLSTLHSHSPRARRILATRHLFDSAPPSSSSSPKADFNAALIDRGGGGGEGKAALTLKGKELVDGIAKAVKELEKACREEKGEGVYEELVRFTEEMFTSVDDADLRAYLSAVLVKTLKALIARSPSLSSPVLPTFATEALSRLASGPASHAQALSLLRTATYRYPKDERLWSVRLDAYLAGHGSEEDADEVIEEARRALPGAVGPAEAWIARVKSTKSAVEAIAIFETALLVAARQPPPSSANGFVPPLEDSLTGAEAFLRAMTTLSHETAADSASRIAFYRHLATLTSLPLRFLRWATFHAEDSSDLPTLEHLHRSIVGHPTADVEAWLEWLRFALVLAKKPINVVAGELEKGKKVLGGRRGAALEKKWTAQLDEQA